MFFREVKAFFLNLKTIYLFGIPFLISIIPMLMLSYYSNHPPVNGLRQEILFCLISFFWGFSGIPLIIRKEAPGIISFYGWLAVVQGILLSGVSWGIMIMLILVKIFKVH